MDRYRVRTAVGRDATEDVRAVVSAVRKVEGVGGARVRDVAAAVGRSEREVRRTLRCLRDVGVLRLALAVLAVCVAYHFVVAGEFAVFGLPATGTLVWGNEPGPSAVEVLRRVWVRVLSWVSYGR